MVEHRIVVPGVVGSNPIIHPIISMPYDYNRAAFLFERIINIYELFNKSSYY